MTITNITKSNLIEANRSIARQFLPISDQQSANQFFRRDALSLGSTPSPYQTYTVSSAIQTDNLRAALVNRPAQAQAFAATPTTRNNEPFSIRNYYAMPPEEVGPKLRQLSEEIYNNDYSGMTGLEIYEWIESKYIEAFGKDFMMGNHLLGNLDVAGSNLSESDKERSSYAYVKIGQHFYGAVNSLTNNGRVSECPHFEINRTRLYGNMSDGEIMDALKAKYPQPMTNRSLALMSGELYSIGITSIGFGSYVSALTLKSGESGTYDTLPPWEVLEQRWSQQLDAPANLSLLYAVQNENMKDKENMGNPYVLQIRDLLIRLGGTLGPDGLFMHDLEEAFLDAIRR